MLYKKETDSYKSDIYVVIFLALGIISKNISKVQYVQAASSNESSLERCVNVCFRLPRSTLSRSRVVHVNINDRFQALQKGCSHCPALKVKPGSFSPIRTWI